MVRKTSFVLVLSAAATPASATLLMYEPFNYGPVGTEISTADGAGGWLKVPTTPATAEPTIASGSLTYAAGLPWTPSGNSVAMVGGATAVQASSTRAIPGQPYVSADQPTMYYSLLLNVSNVAGTASGAGSFVAGFRSGTGTGGLNASEAGAPLLIRQTGTGTGRYELGTGLTQENGDRTWNTANNYGPTDTLLLVLAYQFVSGGEDFARLWINPDPTLSESANAAALKVTATATDGHGIRDGRISNFFLRNNGSAPDNFAVDELRVATSWEGVMSTVVPGIWLGGSGNWSDATKWSGGILPSAATLVAIDAGNTASASIVTLDQDASVKSVTVDAGDQFDIPAGRTLTLSSPLTVSGIVHSAGTVNTTSIAIAGGELHYDGGSIKPSAGIALSSGGKLLMGAGNRVLKATTLSISSTSKVDLSDGKLILTSGTVGTSTNGTYNGVQGEIQRAYDFGAWDGPGGLMTSQNDAGPLVGLTTIGVSTAEQVLFIGATETGVFAGETVTGGSVLAVYTYAGDLNFDGLVDASDYGIIDNYFQFPGTDGYMNGDFNYDGIIDAGDYGLIDNTFQLQGAPIPMSATTATVVVAVPEPAGTLALGAAAIPLLRRRRRRSR